MKTSHITTSIAAVLLAGLPVCGQLALDGRSTLITFDETVPGVADGRFTGAGFQPSPAAGQLDSDAWSITGLSDGPLAFGGTGITGDYARGSSAGRVSTGGIYAFRVGGADDVALGFQATDSDMNPGAITLRVVNQTGGVLNDVAVAYDIYYLNDQGRASTLNFSYSLDDAVYTSLAALDFTSPAAADSGAVWTAEKRSTTLGALNLADGGSLYLRWSTAGAGGSGSRDELAIDNVVIAVPEPRNLAWITGIALATWACFGRRTSRRRAASR